MKRSFTIICLFISLSSFAQKDSVVSYTEVITVPGVIQNDLFVNGRQWFTNTFNDVQSVLSIKDKETGELAGKGLMKLSIGYMGRNNTMVPVDVLFSLNIRVKDGKYKYEFTNFEVVNFWNTNSDFGILKSEQGKDWFGTKKWSTIAYQETKDQVNAETQLLIASLKKAMNNSSDF